jgi:predicted enzyme related to lactoylglutathione lyase
MPNPHGSFIWYELMTTDAAAAGRFYTDVVGWTVGEAGSPVGDYRIFSAGDSAVAGLMTLPAGAEQGGMRPGWFGYIGVDDVDAAVAGITAAGGSVHMPARDLPGVGRLAMVADPQGVVFYVMRGASEESSSSFDPVAAGHCAWNELATSDLDAAIAFYTGQFGWTRGDVMDMGDLGDYRFIHHAGDRIGAMMRQQPGPPPLWSFYFRVPDVDAASKRASERGGTIMHGPAEVPGGDYIVIASDPQGATFSLVGKR